MYNRAKHVDTRIYRIRELSESGEVKLFKVAGENQPADIFTKSLPRPSFMKHRSSLMGSAHLLRCVRLLLETAGMMREIYCQV